MQLMAAPRKKKKRYVCNLISSKFSCIKSLLLIEEILLERECEDSCRTPQPSSSPPSSSHPIF